MYSYSCCSCSFEPEIIKIGQSSHNILNFQESTTILNACTKKSRNLLNTPRISVSLLLILPISNEKFRCLLEALINREHDVVIVKRDMLAVDLNQDFYPSTWYSYWLIRKSISRVSGYLHPRRTCPIAEKGAEVGLITRRMIPPPCARQKINKKRMPTEHKQFLHPLIGKLASCSVIPH